MSEFDPRKLDFSNPQAMYETFKNVDWNDPAVIQVLLHFLRTPKEARKPHQDLNLPVGAVEDIVVLETGYDTKLRIYIPNGQGPFPALFFYHGGGFVLGTHLQDEPFCRRICRDAGVIVVSPDYVHAPEHPWPAAINELYEITKWCLKNAELYEIDPEKLAVGGSSAGGNYAAVQCVLAHERKEFAFQYAALVYPQLDFSIDPKDKQVPGNLVLSTEISRFFVQSYLGKERDRDLKNPVLSPAYANPEAFPTLSIFSAHFDSLAKEEQIFANKLIDAHVEVLYKRYLNTQHGFLELPGMEAASRDCKALIVTQLKHVFNLE